MDSFAPAARAGTRSFTRLVYFQTAAVRWGVLADIHANIEALDAALEAMEEHRVDQIVCAGDVVGYGPDPKACIDRLRELEIPTVKGNHDAVMCREERGVGMNPLAFQAIEWTRPQLTDADGMWLRRLPDALNEADMFVAHASPVRPREWRYVQTVEQAAPQFSAFSQSVALIGHTHVPKVFEYDQRSVRDVFRGFSGVVALKEGCRYVINAGSVGQSRDGNPDGCALVWDADRGQVEFVRFPYPRAITQKKMTRACLSQALIDRLSSGR